MLREVLRNVVTRARKALSLKLFFQRWKTAGHPATPTPEGAADPTAGGAPQSAPPAKPPKKPIKLERVGIAGMIVFGLFILIMARFSHLTIGTSSLLAKVAAGIVVAIIGIAAIIAIVNLKLGNGNDAGSGNGTGAGAGGTGAATGSESVGEDKGKTAGKTNQVAKTAGGSRWLAAIQLLLAFALVVATVVAAAHYSSWWTTAGPGLALLILISLLEVGMVFRKGLRKFAFAVAVFAAFIVILMGGPKGVVAAYRAAQLTPGERIRTEHTNWSEQRLDEPAEDLRKDDGGRFTVTFRENGFHGPLYMPCGWQDWQIQQSHGAGDYFQFWANGSPMPMRIHPHWEPSSDIKEDFKYYPGRDPVWVFWYQGRGTITFVETVSRPSLGIPPCD